MEAAIGERNLPSEKLRDKLAAEERRRVERAGAVRRVAAVYAGGVRVVKLGCAPSWQQKLDRCAVDSLVQQRLKRKRLAAGAKCDIRQAPKKAEKAVDLHKNFSGTAMNVILIIAVKLFRDCSTAIGVRAKRERQ